MNRPGIFPKGEAGTDCGVEMLDAGLITSGGLRGRLEGIVGAAVGGGLDTAADAGDDELFFKASIRFRISSVVLALFSSSVSDWMPFALSVVLDTGFDFGAVDIGGGVFCGGVAFDPPLWFPFFAACNRLRYSARLPGTGEGTDFAAGTLVFTVVVGFELFGIGAFGRAVPCVSLLWLACVVPLVLGADGTGSGSDGRFILL